mmetsp:Transcript_16078/g.18204  ORF Transcript_16078/g.18204 Transcript_16078/m.18204 type:complete len:209 (-) Transcript_16078:1111-1737(-)|eukprot:CAMPEP_0184020848 /NCGR_PEP_ID=MMETSP0954-20121128/9582_1 /TAXON_ID=627963 /ORGANISM="Aplanochytrium sp, Strain PBS07" /LENGTH=208 /DNA_ID=CAMNT_0026302765 /DNA_START=61 /DNA_END=687 /DNA_ORIENTATION=+
MSKVLIEIVSDVMCPWCWVGKRNLEKALEISGRSLSDVQIEWKPFMLRPTIPEEGMEKAPDVPENPRVGRHLKQAGENVGINFTGKTDRTPNTLKAHALLKYAFDQTVNTNDSNIQHRLAEVLFRMYFTDGKFVGSDAVLGDAAEEVGLDRNKALKYLNDDNVLQEVRLEAKRNAAKGVSGVPTFYFNGVPAFSGAQPPSSFLPYLQQ